MLRTGCHMLRAGRHRNRLLRADLHASLLLQARPPPARCLQARLLPTGLLPDDMLSNHYHGDNIWLLPRGRHHYRGGRRFTGTSSGTDHLTEKNIVAEPVRGQRLRCTKPPGNKSIGRKPRSLRPVAFLELDGVPFPAGTRWPLY